MAAWRKQGHTAVVTGGGSGIGLESARRFASDGMNVVIADYDSVALESARDVLSDAARSGAKVVAVHCDVTELAQVEQLRDQVFSECGAVHCLMNNAGVGLPVGAPWENMPELRQTLEINLWGVVNGCRAGPRTSATSLKRIWSTSLGNSL